MIPSELEQILFEELGFAGSPGFLQEAEIPWPNGRAIPNVDRALTLNNIPVAYFSRLSELNPEQIKDLHKKVWSQSKAPLLFVTLPHEIRIYNGYESGPKEGEDLDNATRLLQKLTNLSDYLTAQKEIRKQLVDANHYERVYLETGAFWDTNDGRKINYQNRADQQLVEGMGQMRKKLNESGLSDHIAYTLLGRSIFVRYLEDRKVLQPEWIRQMTNGKASTYREALNNRETTYLLFNHLSKRFNGDLFPIGEDEKGVTATHLRILLSFLNRTNLDTGQLSLWHFDFEFIPIELISHIYDTFIEDQRKSGAFYTPLSLVDFILEETIGNDVIQPDMTVLDPACGSGIFLVGAYRRLIQSWKSENGIPSQIDLNNILQNNIFGVDMNGEAIRIAAFSLYLEILNHLTKDEIRDETFKFPLLLKSNLINCDFFDEERVDKVFAGRKFDRIVGNLPWGRGTLTRHGKEWLDKHELVVGGKQAAPAFMLRVPNFCYEDGEMALLTPAKSTILVTSDTHKVFREHFFSTYNVRAVINFSALVYELFSEAISPAVAIFYKLDKPNLDDQLIYCVPKPSQLSQHLQSIILDTTEVKFLQRRELISCPNLWKVALWGNHRDADLIGRLDKIPKLITQANKLGLGEMREGFMAWYKGGDENEAPWLQDLPFVSAKNFSPYVAVPKEVVEEKVFHRPRTRNIYQAPLVLIHHSLCEAAFSNNDIAFRNGISSITGTLEQIPLLKWLVCVVNSPLIRYFMFLTSTRWAVERKNPLHKEYTSIPFLMPDFQNEKFGQVLDHFDKLTEILNEETAFYDTVKEQIIRDHKKAINQLIFDLYKIYPVEQQLIEDTIEYEIEFFNWSKRKNRKPREASPVKRPNIDMLKAYADIFVRTASSLLQIKDKALNGTIYQNGAPLTAISFDIVDHNEAKPVQIITQPNAMRLKLRELDKFLLEQKSPSMYIRRHVRVYDGDQMSLVRPSEQRFWTQSQARVDADEFLADLSV